VHLLYKFALRVRHIVTHSQQVSHDAPVTTCVGTCVIKLSLSQKQLISWA
jgi:hypothetical protein